MAPSLSRAADNEPLLRPNTNDLAIAPELGVLAALDATAATAAYQLTAENPDLGLDALAAGHTPGADARKAGALVLRIHGLRAAIRQYRQLVLNPDRDRDQLPLPF